MDNVNHKFSETSAQVVMAEEPQTENSTNGVKLPYFHRTLSQEDTDLIGDITPKQINPSIQAVETINSGSAWNTAGTWEEKNCSKKAKDMMKAFLSTTPPVNKDGYEVTCEEVSDVTGHANIVSSRGKPRYLFEFESIKIKFEAHNPSSSSYYKGDICLIDVTNDQVDENELEMNVEWDGLSPPGLELKRLKNLLVQGDMRKNIVSKLMEFEREFRRL